MPPKYTSMLESIQDTPSILPNMISELYQTHIEENTEKFYRLFKNIILEFHHTNISASQALYRAFKISFDVFLIKANLLLSNDTTENDIYIYQLLSYAERFETYSPLLDIATNLVSEVYKDTETILKAKIIILQDRLYTFDASYVQEKLDNRVQKFLANSQKKVAELLREKIAIERSCNTKASQILITQAESNRTRGEFLNRFPLYIKEEHLKFKSHLLLTLRREIIENGMLSEDSLLNISKKLCSAAGEQMDLKEIAQTSKLWGKNIFSEYDLGRVEQFTRTFTKEILDLLKIAHPDKWNTQGAPEEMADIIKKKSNEIINIRELSKLGPLIGTSDVFLLLKKFKADFAMLHPEAALNHTESQESKDLELEIAMWTASDSFLTEKLNMIWDDPEINRMRQMLSLPEETQEAYQDELRLSIFSLTQGIKKLCENEKINSSWNLVVSKSIEIALNPEKLKIFIADLSNIEKE